MQQKQQLEQQQQDRALIVELLNNSFRCQTRENFIDINVVNACVVNVVFVDLKMTQKPNNEFRISRKFPKISNQAETEKNFPPICLRFW